MSLSHSQITVATRIKDMVVDIQKSVTGEIMEHKIFSLQLDESVDVAGIPQ